MRRKRLKEASIDKAKLVLGCESTSRKFAQVMVVVVIQRWCNKNYTRVFTGMQVNGVYENHDLILRISCVLGIFDDEIFTVGMAVGSHESIRKKL